MWGCAAAKGPSTTAEHLVSGLRGTESLIQELFVQSSKCNGICPTRAQVVEGGGVDPRELLGENSDLHK